MNVKFLRLIAGPLFWIGLTWAGITYGPDVIAGIQGKKSVGEVKGKIIEKSAISTEIKQATPPKNLEEIPMYAKQVVEIAADRVIQSGISTAQQTKEQVALGVCEQIITEVRKQCGMVSPTPEPIKSE